jgi:hypothetical protein
MADGNMVATEGEAPQAGGRRRWVRRAVILAVVVGVIWVLLHLVGLDGVAMAYFHGWRAAGNDLASGRARFLSCRCDISGQFDDQTGLTVYGTGYPANAVLAQAFIHAYNTTIHRYIRDHGLPSNSKKAWSGILMDVQRYWDRQTAVRPPDVIPRTGRPRRSRGTESH